jgi:hypothetical protein
MGGHLRGGYMSGAAALIRFDREGGISCVQILSDDEQGEQVVLDWLRSVTKIFPILNKNRFLLWPY